ncbi:hypothetical protein F3Y22_tig00112857pilonHSYRG00176 [Hibiscus syriacus]|uniref:UDP-glycosyltransferases domain-containing protein n=1 Tax=Hibiscus syriacus TaxID=106335 RepID=A0A6A2WT32_HIBSY|nr:hypothetical protein F3Y22_tig00112857pilonHSYRG00176 [Hibiscus syriacus]
MAKKEAIVLYPAPWVTLHTSMVELANLLLIHQPSLYIHILAIAIPSQHLFSAAVCSAITFHNLPTVDLRPPTTHLDTFHFDFIRLNIPNLRRFLLTISESYTLNVVIVDFYCSRRAFEVASDLDLPAYCFYTGAAGSLASLLYLPTLHSKSTQSFEDYRDLLIDIPGVPPILSSDMPLPGSWIGPKTGYLLKSWAPQAAVLSHDSIGGFVTHCGWNLVLESVCARVPMLAWPLYAEQRYNRVLMVEEMKIALPMELETGLVYSTEVENESRNGSARVAVSEEGSS